MRIPRPRLAALAAAALFALLASLARAGEAPPVELVQTVPAETDLAANDLRHAKDVWVDMAEGAKESIDLAQFYVSNREGKSDLEPVLAALERAGERGVKVRVLLSSRMLKNDMPSHDRLKAIPGAEVRAWDLAPRTSGVLHAKYWVVDRKEVFVGSQNLDWRALTHIHEMGLRVRDERIAAELSRIFEGDLAMARGREPPEGTGEAAPAAASGTARPELELVASPPSLNPRGIRPALEALKELIGGARASLDIQLLDYDTADRFSKEKRGPWLEIDDALRAAARRGVKVRLLVSHWNTERGAIRSLKALSGVENIAIRVDEFPRAAEGFIPFARVAHAKYMVVDGETLWLGTSNWLRDYFYASRNVELIARRPALAKQAAAVFERLWTSRYAADFDPQKRYPKPEKGVSREEEEAKKGAKKKGEEEE
jgi:phosphatidylserine/phosphatidylglycerophosphate/cardiolipin synthase-like enzyme